jgi:hypothetical protein
MYRFVDRTQAASELAKALKKPVLYINFEGLDDWDELFKAAPYLREAFANREQKNRDNPMQCVADGTAIIVCDTDKERDNLYEQTVGDDGPTKFNSYRGPVHVYALTIGRDGQFLNENT